MKHRQSGVALVLVLWVITLLTVIAGNFAYSMRGEAQIAANLLQSVQAQTKADSGVQVAWFQLMKKNGDPTRWTANGALHQLVLDGVTVQVSIYDEAGLINLNTASDELLKGLFVSVGLDDQASTLMTAAILDWRSPGSLKRLNGAKEDDYRAAGRAYGPSNAPFRTIDEVQRVLGMSPDLYRKIVPAVTIFSGGAQVDTKVAPLEVLLALPDATPAKVDAFLRRRIDAQAAGQTLPTFEGTNILPLGSLGSQTYRVRSEVQMNDGTQFVRVAVGRIGQDAGHPVKLLEWREGDTASAFANNTMIKN